MQPAIWSAGSDGHRVEWSSLLSRRCETNRRCNNAGSTRHYTRADGASTSATLPGRKVLLGRVALDTGGRSAARGLSGSRWVRLRSTAEDRLRGCVDPLRRIPHRRLHPRHPNRHSLRRSRYRRGRGVSRNPERPARATPRGACERSLPPIPGGDLLVLSVRPYSSRPVTTLTSGAPAAPRSVCACSGCAWWTPTPVSRSASAAPFSVTSGSSSPRLLAGSGLSGQLLTRARRAGTTRSLPRWSYRGKARPAALTPEVVRVHRGPWHRPGHSDAPHPNSLRADPVELELLFKFVDGFGPHVPELVRSEFAATRTT